MAVGDLITGDWQIERGDLLTGDTTVYDIRQIMGLGELLAVKVQDRPLTRRHGSTAGIDKLGERTFTISYEIVDDAASSMSTKLAALSAAFQSSDDESVMAFQVPGVAAGTKAQVSGRVRMRVTPIGVEYSRGVASVAFQVVCTDPRIYSQVENSTQVGLAGTSGGATFNAVFDLSFGAVASGGTVNVTNAGDFDAPAVFRIDGPCTTPIVENVTQGRLLKLNLTVASGDYITLDTKARTVTLNGSASRYPNLDTSSRWFDLTPGANAIHFRAATATAATCTTTWRDAWA